MTDLPPYHPQYIPAIVEQVMPPATSVAGQQEQWAEQQRNVVEQQRQRRQAELDAQMAERASRTSQGA
jgi:hypothetical protein